MFCLHVQNSWYCKCYFHWGKNFMKMLVKCFTQRLFQSFSVSPVIMITRYYFHFWDTVKHKIFMWPYFRADTTLDIFTRHYFCVYEVFVLESFYEKSSARTLWPREFTKKIKSSRIKSVLHYFREECTFVKNARITPKWNFTRLQELSLGNALRRDIIMLPWFRQLFSPFARRCPGL